MAKKDLVKAAANLPAVDREAVAAALRGAADDASSGGSGSYDYMSFSGKSGKYKVGKNSEAPDPDAVYIVEPLAAYEGWVCWKGSRAVGKHEWDVRKRAALAVAEENLEEKGPYKEGDGWQPLLGISMVDVDTQRQIRFSTSSKSGRNVFADLNNLMADEIVAGGDGCAVIELGVEEFTAHEKKNYKPVIDVVAFVSRPAVELFLSEEGADYSLDDLLDGKVDAAVKEAAPEADPVEEPVEEPVEQEPEEKPKRPARKARPKAEAEAPEEKPAGRRRRRAA